MWVDDDLLAQAVPHRVYFVASYATHLVDFVCEQEVDVGVGLDVVKQVLSGTLIDGNDKFSNLIYFLPDRQPYFYTAAPIKKNGQIVGGVMIAIKVDRLLLAHEVYKVLCRNPERQWWMWDEGGSFPTIRVDPPLKFSSSSVGRAPHC